MREEITGWRDEEISRRHRLYGMNVPAVDVDFLLVEYDRGQAVALIDYKRRADKEWIKELGNLGALARLYDSSGAQLPFFVVQYRVSDWRFRIHALNEAAIEALQKHGYRDDGVVTEYDYVRFLYALRGRDMPELAIFFDK